MDRRSLLGNAAKGAVVLVGARLRRRNIARARATLAEAMRAAKADWM